MRDVWYCADDLTGLCPEHMFRLYGPSELTEICLFDAFANGD